MKLWCLAQVADASAVRRGLGLAAGGRSRLGQPGFGRLLACPEAAGEQPVCSRWAGSSGTHRRPPVPLVHACLALRHSRNVMVLASNANTLN